MAFILQNCSDIEESIIVTNDLTGYSVVSLEEYPETCWTVSEETEDAGINVTIVHCYDTCEECLRIVYRLTDCTGRLQPRYTQQPEFEDLVDKIVKVPFYDNACFTVIEVLYSNGYEYEHITYSRSYDTCGACRERKKPAPVYNPPCDPDKIETVLCNFSDLMYQQVLSKKFGVTTSCPEEILKWSVKEWLLNFELMNHTSPELPEPIVESCCIDTSPSTPTCTPCDTPVEEQECPCKCQASVDSPHDCHTYTFTIVDEMIADATGNTDTNLNGKVYFGYIPCGKTDAVTVVHDAAGEEQEYCVLGIPILGWFKDDEWVNSSEIPEDNLLRGAVCEAEEEDECSPCNTCN